MPARRVKGHASAATILGRHQLPPANVAGSEEVTVKTEQKHILVADDDKDIQELLSTLLTGEGYRISQASNGSQVLAFVSKPDACDLVLMDVRMPDLDGIQNLQRMEEQGIKVPVIVMTAYGTSTVAIRAIQLGAYDYVAKPFDIQDVLLTIQRLFHQQKLERELEDLRDKLQHHDPTERIVGRTPVMQDIYKTIGRVARTSTTVLICGETGTGKNLVAEAIHLNSTYRHGPLVKVTCAALPETLLESELFGHEKGSFTGAQTQKKGYFEVAHHGTIFLDEIGEMSLGTQKKLLHVLQDKQFERVGGTAPIKIDARVIAATNKNLQEEVAAGRFREDLYYRLNVVPIFMPPLRAHKEDIPALVAHFLDTYRYNAASGPARIAKDSLDALVKYDWPGNVRELENVIERAVVLTQGGIITKEYLTFASTYPRRIVDIESKVQRRTPISAIMLEVEREIIAEAVSQAKGNLPDAASSLGLSLDELFTRIKDLGLREGHLNGELVWSALH